MIGFWREITLRKLLNFEQIGKVVFGKQPFRKDIFEQGVSFVATYHLNLEQLGKLIKKLQSLLYMIVRLKEFFDLLLKYLAEVLKRQTTT